MRKRLVLLAFVSVLLSTTLSLCVVGLLELQIAYALPRTDISVDTAYDMITNGSYPDLVVLDVRWQYEYDGGHIYGAVWIPYTELDERIGELAGHENHEIIVYCASGGRSVTASNTLESNGFTKVYNLLGGFNKWDDDYPVWIATVHNVNTTFNYDTIQAAIDVPQTLDGHTILVDTGTYLEHVTINKSLSLIGENRETTIIDGNGTGNVVYVTADNVSIRGFTIQNSGSNGIYAYRSNGNNISHNIITNNQYGIFFDESSNNMIVNNDITENSEGFYLRLSSNNIVSDNSITNNDNGAWLYESSSNIIHGNNMTGNTWHGISFYSSNNNSISRNEMANNYVGIEFEASFYNIISENIIKNNNDGALLDNSTSNSFVGNDITNNNQGVYLGESLSNSISENSIINNEYGIYFNGSSNNSISGNNITNNIQFGILLNDSSNNLIYYNNFVDNQEHALDYSATNVWDDCYPSGGNYWSDHEFVDEFSGPNQNETGSDGIVDDPYEIDANNTDGYPLMNPWITTETSVQVEGEDYPVVIVSNTTISQMAVTQNTLSFNSSGTIGEKGYINVIFPMVNTTAIEVFIDGNKLTPPPFPVITSNGTHYFIYFEFTLSNHTIAIQFASMVSVGGISLPVDKLELLAPYIGLTVLLAVAVTTVVYVKYRKKRH